MTRSRQYIGTGDSGSFIVIGKILDDILQITLQNFTQRIQPDGVLLMPEQGCFVAWAADYTG